MGYLIGCLVAALSFLLNRTLVRRIGPAAIISYGPLLEESTKTLPAFLLGADILAVHITFGLAEAAYDWYQNARSGSKAALFSVAGHSLFGSATVFILALSGSIWLALAAGVVAHLVWNVSVIRRYA